MRALLSFVVVGLIALTTLLVACSGDEDAMDGQSVGQSVGQAVGQAQDAEEQQAQRSSGAGDEQSQPDRRAAADDDEQQAQGVQTAQSQSGASATDAAVANPLLADAASAYQGWVDGLDTMEIDFVIDFNLFGVEVQVEASAVYRQEPFAILTTLDASGLLSAAGAMAGAETDAPDELAVMYVLLTQDGGYMSLPGLGGWADLTGNVDDTLGGFTALFGAPSSLGDPSELGQGLACAELIGGVVTLSRLDGENVWLIDCEIDAATIDAAARQALAGLGIDLSDSGIETIRLRTAVNRETGAPMMVESNVELADLFAFGDDDSSADADAPALYINSVGVLRNWNQPVEIPTPEPLLDPSVIDAFTGVSGSAEDGTAPPAAQDEPERLLTAEELIGLASEWANSVDELQMEFVAQAVIDGEARLATTLVRSSRSQGAFETGVVIDDSATFRLLWNRDGIWTSAEDAAAGTVWEPSDPAVLGFAGLTVDEFLANPDRVNLAPYIELLNLSWLTRTIEGGGPPVYELVIESGPRWPGDDYFDQLVELLKAETAELLAENIVVESIEHFSTTIRIYGDNGEIASQITTAEFESNSGRVDLAASLILLPGSPIEFSSPGN